MNRTFFLTLAALFSFAAFPVLACAQVSINEIFSDANGSDGGREWVEVLNTSNGPVNLSHWKFFEGGTNHALTALTEATTSAGQFVVIVENVDAFKADNPNFSGLIFDSSFSLANKGETIALKNEKGVVVDSVTFGTSVEGLSFQKIGAEWIKSVPTVGVPNKENVSAPAPVPAVTTKPKSTSAPTPSKKSVGSNVTVKTGAEPVFSGDLPQVARPQSSGNNLWVWLSALIGIVAVTLIGLHFVNGKTETVLPENPLPDARDFQIIEEKEDA